jgi:hypothetical protein
VKKLQNKGKQLSDVITVDVFTSIIIIDGLPMKQFVTLGSYISGSLGPLSEWGILIQVDGLSQNGGPLGYHLLFPSLLVEFEHYSDVL